MRPPGIALKWSLEFCERVLGVWMSACVCSILYLDVFCFVLFSSCSYIVDLFLPLRHEDPVFKESGGCRRNRKNTPYRTGNLFPWAVPADMILSFKFHFCFTTVKHTSFKTHCFLIACYQSCSNKVLAHEINSELLSLPSLVLCALEWVQLEKNVNVHGYSISYPLFLFVKWIRLQRGSAPLICSLLWRSGKMTSYWSQQRLVIGSLSSSSGTGQTEHTSGARQCESDALGFSRVAGGASVQTRSQEASQKGCAGPTVNVRNEWRASTQNEIWYNAPQAQPVWSAA